MTEYLNNKDKDMLRKIHELESKPYPPVPSDLTSFGAHNVILYRLFKLERMNYVRLHRDRKRIRKIEVLALP